jgi:hypothetical protein
MLLESTMIQGCQFHVKSYCIVCVSGGAISQAKGAFSSWWSTITNPPSNSQTDKIDELPEDGLEADPEYIMAPETTEDQGVKDESWVTLDQMRQKARKNKSNADKSKLEKEVAVTKDFVKTEQNVENSLCEVAQNEIR